MTLGLIAGNGRFPFLLLDAARAEGLEVVVAAIKEETDPEIDRRAESDSGVTVHWLSLGELSRLIETFRDAGVAKAVMAGQVKHKQIFSSIRPDWRLAKLLLNLRTRSTDALLGAVAKMLSDEGIELIAPPASWSLCWRKRACSPAALLTRTNVSTSSTAWAWRAPSPPSTSAKPWSSLRRLAWPSRPWKARTQRSNALAD